jgi:pseudouridine-5'-phosphate glycosidase
LYGTTLRRVRELTKGASLESNIALVKNNARVGSEIALALTELEKQPNR